MNKIAYYLLALAFPLIAMLTNISMSIYLKPNVFGTITFINSLSLVITAIASLGLSSYFMSNELLYQESRRFVLLSLTFTGFLFGGISILFVDSSYSIAVFTLVLSSQLFYFLQIEFQLRGKLIYVVVSQNAVTLIKALSSIMIMISLYSGVGTDVEYSDVIFIFSLIIYIIIFPLVFNKTSSKLNGKFFIDKVFNKNTLYFFWISYLLNFLPIFFMPVLSGFLVGSEVVGYFGIYMIFQSISLVIAQHTILNSYYFRFSKSYSDNDLFTINILSNEVIKKSITIAFFLFPILLVIAYIGVINFWKNYDNIFLFLLTIMPCSVLKIVQTGCTMRLTLSDKLSLKLKIQLCYLIVLFIFSYLLYVYSALGLAVALLASEVILTGILIYFNIKLRGESRFE